MADGPVGRIVSSHKAPTARSELVKETSLEVPTRQIGAAGRIAWFNRAVMNLRRCWPLLIAAVLGLAVRVYAIAVRNPECPANATALTQCFRLAGDPMYYELQALNLSAGKGFLGLSLAPSAQHPPLFPIWLSLLDRIGVSSVQSHRVASGVLGTLGVLLVGLLGMRLGKDRGVAVGVVAATLVAIYPGFWISDAELRAESLFVPVTALGLLMAHRLWDRQTLRDAVWFGLAAGLMWSTRPEAILFVILLVPVMLVRFDKIKIKRRLVVGAISLTVPALMMAPWVYYNYARFSQLIVTTTTGQALLLNACDDSFYGAFPGYQSYTCLNVPVAPWKNEAAVDNGYREVAMSYLSKNRESLPLIGWIKVRRVWGAYSVSETLDLDGLLEGYQRDGAAGTMAFYYGMLPFGAGGIWLLYRRREPLAPLVITFVVVTITAILVGPLTRLRVPADLALCLLSAVCVVAVACWLRAWLGVLRSRLARILVHSSPGSDST